MCSSPSEVFDRLVKEGNIDGWTKVSNDVRIGEKPIQLGGTEDISFDWGDNRPRGSEYSGQLGEIYSRGAGTPEPNSQIISADDLLQNVDNAEVPNLKVSQTYTNTGKNGGGWNDAEYNKYTDPKDYLYETKSELDSLPDAEPAEEEITNNSSDGLNWDLSNGYNLKNTKTYQRAVSAGVSDADFNRAWYAADADGNGYMKKAEAQAYVNTLPDDVRNMWFNILYKGR